MCCSGFRLPIGFGGLYNARTSTQMKAVVGSVWSAQLDLQRFRVLGSRGLRRRAWDI